MRKTFALAAAVCCIAASANSFGATVVTGGGAGRAPTAAEMTGDASLAGKKVYDFFVTTDSDILSVDNVIITGGGASLYQNAAGSDVEPPNPLFLPVFPALGADSWISTPGGTSTAGGGFPNDNSSWFDSSDDGAQNNFQFARLTTSTPSGTFAGRVNTLGPNSSVINTPFSLTFGAAVPEPATLAMTGLALVGMVACSRRKA
jgi:hypothetical protein